MTLYAKDIIFKSGSSLHLKVVLLVFLEVVIGNSQLATIVESQIRAWELKLKELVALVLLYVVAIIVSLAS